MAEQTTLQLQHQGGNWFDPLEGTARSEITDMRAYPWTRTNLKILAAYQGQTMLSILDRLVREELAREEEKRKVRAQAEDTE